MCDLGSLEMGEIDLREWVRIGMNWGCCNIVLTILNHARDNLIGLGVFGAVSEV